MCVYYYILYICTKQSMHGMILNKVFTILRINLPLLHHSYFWNLFLLKVGGPRVPVQQVLEQVADLSCWKYVSKTDLVLFGKTQSNKLVCGILQRDKYIPEAEAVFDQEMKVYASILKEQSPFTFPNEHIKIYDFMKKYWQKIKNMFHKKRPYFLHSDYLILIFSDWFSDFGKSLWRPFRMIPLLFLVFYGMTSWGYEDYQSVSWQAWSFPSFLRDFFNFSNPFTITQGVNLGYENHKFHPDSSVLESLRIFILAILYIVSRLIIAYTIYNFIRATRRFNRGN